jgi:predicted transcriptional regulator YheO
MSETLVLSNRERAILYSYRDTLEGLAEYLGSGYEIVLHCLESYEHSVIKIINGFHTGRTEGAPITNLALAMLSELKQQPGTPHAIVYFAQNRKGEPLKSTTIPILGDSERIIGLICINFYMNTPLSELIQAMRPQEFASTSSLKSESFAESAEEMLALTLNEVIPEVKGDQALKRSVHNKEIVRRLWERGVFDIKGSVETVAEALKLSPNTVYLHLRNLHGGSRA